MVRLIFGVMLVVSSYATVPGVSGEYFKISWHDSVVSAGDVIPDVAHANANGEDCSAGIFAEMLIKIPPNTYANQAALDLTESILGSSGQLTGACVTVDATDATPQFANAVEGQDVSFFFTKTSAQRYTVVTAALPSCTGALAYGATGFDLTDGTDCGGLWATNTDNGVGLVGVTLGWPMTGTRFTGKHVALQIMGPFSAAECTTPDASVTDNYPIVIPTEAKTTGDVTIPAVSTTLHCNDFGSAIAAGNHNIYTYKLGATKGEIIFSMNSDTTGITYTGADMTCVPKPSGTIYHSFKLTTNLRGGYDTCVQSSTTDGGTPDTTKYFKVIIDPKALGSLPNQVDEPSSAPGADCVESPAMGLHLSASMAALIALIAMMM